MTPMYGMDEEFKIRRDGKTARPIALTMRAVPFEAMMAVSTVTSSPTRCLRATSSLWAPVSRTTSR